MLVFDLSLSPKQPKKDLVLSYILATIGFQILQSVGGYLISRELTKLSSLYGSFALVVGILFWIYLLSQIVLYSMEVAIVYKLKLWPRSLTTEELTNADKHALRLYAQRERLVSKPHEKVDVHFSSS